MCAWFCTLAAEALGLPFISPYLQSIGSDYRHGANYATLASTVLLPNTSLFVTGISPFSLAIQLNQMKEFKIKVDELHGSSDKTGKPWWLQLFCFILFLNTTPQMLECCFIGSTKLPSPAIFGKSLYTFYIGQNDFTSNLAAIGIGGVKQYLSQVVSQIAGTIKVSTSITCSDWQPWRPKPNINWVGPRAHYPTM